MVKFCLISKPSLFLKHPKRTNGAKPTVAGLVESYLKYDVPNCSKYAVFSKLWSQQADNIKSLRLASNSNRRIENAKNL